MQLPEQEERQKGTVGMKVYVEYFKHGAGLFKFILLIIFNLTAQGAYIMSDWWLSRWCVHSDCNSDDDDDNHNYNNSNDDVFVFTGLSVKKLGELH